MSAPVPSPRFEVAFRRPESAGGLDVLAGGKPVGFLTGKFDVWLHVLDPKTGAPRAVARVKNKAPGWPTRREEAKALARVLFGHLTPAAILDALDGPPAKRTTPVELARRFGFDPFNGSRPE